MRRNGLKSGFLATTALMTAALGYGRKAYAQQACYQTAPATVLCDGSANYVNYNNGLPTAASGWDYTFTPGGAATSITVALAPTTVLSTAGAYGTPYYGSYRPGDLIRITGDTNVTLNATRYSYLYSTTGNAVYLYNNNSGNTGNINVTTAFQPANPGYPDYDPTFSK